MVVIRCASSAWCATNCGAHYWPIYSLYDIRFKGLTAIRMGWAHRSMALQSEWTVKPLNLWGPDEDDRMIKWVPNLVSI